MLMVMMMMIEGNDDADGYNLTPKIIRGRCLDEFTTCFSLMQTKTYFKVQENYDTLPAFDTEMPPDSRG